MRAIIDTSKEVKGSNNETINAVGRKVKIDLAALIDEVYVAPTCPHWFLELVDDITKKYGLHVSVERSSLDNTPMF